MGAVGGSRGGRGSRGSRGDNIFVRRLNGLYFKKEFFFGSDTKVVLKLFVL